MFYHYADCHAFIIVMLNVVMLSVMEPKNKLFWRRTV